LITYIYIIGAIGTVFFIYYFISVFIQSNSSEQKEYNRKLKESLEDEFIIDPETGAKITLEQAESGHWIAHDNEFRTIPDSELEKFLTEDDKQTEIAINYLRESRNYKRTELTERQIKILDNTKMLKKYDNWSYSNSFSFEKGIVFLPAPELHGKTYYEDDYKESHLLFWKKITDLTGHYYLREKTSPEKILDTFKKDDDLTLKNYESFTFEKSFNIIKLNKILKNFENQSGLEIEIHNDDLFVKTMNLVCKEDIIRIEKVMKNVG